MLSYYSYSFHVHPSSPGWSNSSWPEAQHCGRRPFHQCLVIRSVNAYVFSVFSSLGAEEKHCWTGLCFPGHGHFFYKGQVEDSATAEISRSQVGPDMTSPLTQSSVGLEPISVWTGTRQSTNWASHGRHVVTTWVNTSFSYFWRDPQTENSWVQNTTPNIVCFEFSSWTCL